ncbi:hypothetical protein HWV62_1925 [Athelia sp. TMB]|nr:hypothetical protein HWV62_1925 [Athelia sp. TMB]
MVALPSLDTCGLHGTGLTLWRQLLQVEDIALKDPSYTKYNDPLIGIRLLGFFLKDFWEYAHDGYLGYNPYARMAMGISSCFNKLDDKATYDALVELVRTNKRGRPTPSQQVSRPSFGAVQGRILEDLGNVPQTRSNVKKQDYAAAVSAILEMFGLGSAARTLYGNEVNCLHNVITMAINLRSAFDSLNLWLEPVPGQENIYDVRGKLLGRYPVPTPSRVTFSVEPSAAAAAEAVNKELMLPDSILIAIRASCARVANLSGAAEQANRILRDLEDTTVLADDGSMAELLSSRLSASTPRCSDIHLEGDVVVP